MNSDKCGTSGIIRIHRDKTPHLGVDDLRLQFLAGTAIASVEKSCKDLLIKKQVFIIVYISVISVDDIDIY